MGRAALCDDSKAKPLLSWREAAGLGERRHAQRGPVGQACASNTWCFHRALVKMQIARSHPKPALLDSFLGPRGLGICILSCLGDYDKQSRLETSGQEHSCIQDLCLAFVEPAKCLWTRPHEQVEGASERKSEKLGIAGQDDATLGSFLSKLMRCPFHQVRKPR